MGCVKRKKQEGIKVLQRDGSNGHTQAGIEEEMTKQTDSSRQTGLCDV